MRALVNEKQCVLPNFFVVGAARAGTTTLYRHLKAHREIYVCPIKEPSYFSKDIDLEALYGRSAVASSSVIERILRDSDTEIHQAYIRQWEDYLRLFANANGHKAVGEC